jgi:hypothetical protein
VSLFNKRHTAVTLAEHLAALQARFFHNGLHRLSNPGKLAVCRARIKPAAL